MAERTGRDGTIRINVAGWFPEKTVETIDTLARAKGWSRTQVLIWAVDHLWRHQADARDDEAA